ncbi:diaminopimelate epimerase [Candidatus Calescamantes bacterium]|nr:diaminopimelate epimerase [Candidatus Calescamantes bacterium]
MRISFWKMEGGGNDFVVINNLDGLIKEEEKWAFCRKILHPKFGVGGDGLILIEPSSNYDFRMRIFNPDGSEPTMCGNGARCAVRFAVENGLVSRFHLKFETGAGVIEGEIKGKEVKILLSPPRELKLDYPLKINGEEIIVSSVNTGVPHVILEIENLEEIDVKEKGKSLRYHPEFQPEGTNVNFVRYKNRNLCEVRVYERGVEDETLCCGTGGVACAVIGIEKGILSSPVEVHFIKGGERLKVYFEEGKYYLEGKVWKVFEGIYEGGRYGEAE